MTRAAISLRPAVSRWCAGARTNSRWFQPLRTAAWVVGLALAAGGFTGERNARAEDPEASTQASSGFLAYGASATTQELVAVRFHMAEGKLQAAPVERVPLGIQAAPVVLHPQHPRMYVASLRAAPERGNRLLTFTLGKDGRLQEQRHTHPLQHGSAYLSLDRTGRFLLSASYFSGHVDIYRLDSQGFPERLTHTTYEGRNKAHSIRTSRDNRFAYIPYVKEHNGLQQYAFDAKRGRLIAQTPARAEVPEGAGPRHVAYHPNQPFVYFSNEQHLGATAYRIGRNGALRLLGACDPGEQKPAAGVAASDIVITRDGRYVFVAVRDFAAGKVDAIHRYAVETGGNLRHLGHVAADAIPWGLELSPDGRLLLVTAAQGETLTAFSIGKQGQLTRAASIRWGKMIRDIAVVPPTDR